MNNISFAKDMSRWSQKEVPANTAEEITNVMEEISDDNNFSLSLDNEITSVINLMNNINVLYAMKAYKELYDIKIHLSMVHHLLQTIRQ